MASSKKIVSPQEAAGQEPAPSSESAPSVETVRFWKALNPHEKIAFKDGTVLVFGQQTFATADAELIAKIEAVASSYRIFRQ